MRLLKKNNLCYIVTKEHAFAMNWRARHEGLSGFVFRGVRSDGGKVDRVATIVDVNETNVEQTGFFCMRSQPDADGYRRKLHWLKRRFAEGLKIKIVEDGGHQGFIEYAPIEHAWRAVLGENYMVIHCLWIDEHGIGKGYGSRLLDACIRDAKAQNKSGVAVVTSSGGDTGLEPWLAGKDFFMKHGFELADQAPPSFELMVKRFDDRPVPRFPGDWAERTSKYGKGLIVIRSDQCPFFDQAVQLIAETADELGLDLHVVDLADSRDARNAPAAFGTFAILYDGKLLSHHPLTKRDLMKRIESMRRS